MMLHPLPRSTCKRAPRLLLEPKSLVGTVPPCPHLGLVPVFPSTLLVLPCSCARVPYRGSSPFPALFLNLAFSCCFLILQPFPTRACSTHWAIFAWTLTCCYQHVQGSAGLRHYRYRGSSAFLQARKIHFQQQSARSQFLLGYKR